ncbi:MAG: aminotransferase class I/II-fold pyridoxal phosphate-dependent enzyme, partial [Planctomycetes bacterium]|nr:aminotransferase class I/II-fold pyridoxal phosphate-dependent enzyme [Planctomycetota bacterium]
IEAHIQALRDGHTRYELDAGLPQLREAIAAFYSQRYGIELDAENVLITTGCCQALYLALTAGVQPGKEIIVTEPYFVLAHIAEMAGAVLRVVPTTARNGYQLDPQQVIDAIGDNTCAILLLSPGNPTGAVYPRATVEAICRAAAERGVTVISDEVYDRLILDDIDYASALDSSPTLDNVIMASSFSKTYSMAGLRLGWAISSRRNIVDLQRYHMFVSTCENTPTQWAAVAALTGDQSPVDHMVKEYRRRRDRVVELVEAAPHLRAYKPQGAFFIMPSLPAGTDSFDLCMRPGELTDGATLAERCPDTRFIVDHCGNADVRAFLPAARSGGAPPSHDVARWQMDMSRLAGHGNVICKISGIVASAPPGWSARDLRPIVDFCLDAFGPDRVVFGSDWPVCKLGATYGEWVGALKTITATRPLGARRKLFHDNAVKFYGLS